MINERGIKSIKADIFWPISQGEGVNIAVIDTGCNLEYPVFSGSILGAKNYVGEEDTIVDDSGHGTHVSGIIKSIAPKCSILPIRVFNKYGIGFNSLITDALKYAYFWRGQNGERIHIINMSLGCPSPDEQMHTVIEVLKREGIYVAAAAGNDGDGDPNTEERSYPAFFNESICVAGCDYQGNIMRMSNTGRETDISAPAENIYSCYKYGAYTEMTGTSMGPPHVSGALALLRNAFVKKYGEEALQNIDLKNELMRRTKQVARNTYAEGAGMIDLSIILDEFR